MEEALPKAKEQGETQVTAPVEAVRVDGEVEQTTAEPELEGYVGEREHFRLRQVTDPTLKEAWEKARAHGMNRVDGLLCHKDEVVGRPCNQLVLPEPKRADVLCVAHDSGWEGSPW